MISVKIRTLVCEVREELDTEIMKIMNTTRNRCRNKNVNNNLKTKFIFAQIFHNWLKTKINISKGIERMIKGLG